MPPNPLPIPSSPLPPRSPSQLPHLKLPHYETAAEKADEPEMNPDNPNLPALKGDYDWDADYAVDTDWITENIPGKVVLG